MSAISDSSQEASNAALGLTPVSSPNIFLKSEIPELPTNLFHNSELLKPGSSTEQSQKRRSSSRSIKRKKFDDELVESSLVKVSRPRPQNPTFPVIPPSVGLVSPSVLPPPSFVTTTPSQGPPEAAPVLSLEKRKVSRPSQKRIKKTKTSQAALNKDVSRWKPVDDLSLILSVQQTNDIETVHRGVKFSSKFTLREVQERWYSLLYDATISKTALFAIKQLNPEIIHQIKAKVLFSAEEEKLISCVPINKGSLETFQELLDSNASIFLPSRTAKVLLSHWTLMKQYNLLQDQSAQQPMPVESITTFSDNEDLIEDSELQDVKDSSVEEELLNLNRKHIREIKQLENEVPKWQVLVDCVTGVSISDFDTKTLAVLRGRIVRYLIQSREVSFGRSAKDGSVDIDLSLEGPAWKISRRQGVIKIDSVGEFCLVNEGKKPIFVDGKPVLNGNKYKLSNNSVIEITVLRFIFIINQEAMNAYKNRNSA